MKWLFETLQGQKQVVLNYTTVSRGGVDSQKSFLISSPIKIEIFLNRFPYLEKSDQNTIPCQQLKIEWKYPGSSHPGIFNQVLKQPVKFTLHAERRPIFDNFKMSEDRVWLIDRYEKIGTFLLFLNNRETYGVCWGYREKFFVLPIIFAQPTWWSKTT